MKKINLFLDSNIYLNFYHYSNDDIKALDGLASIIRDSKKIQLYINDQIISEVERNRESKIKDAIDRFTKNEYKDQIPDLFSGFGEIQAIKNHINSAQKLKQKLLLEVKNKIKERKLAADLLIDSLFIKKDSINEDILGKAKIRFDRGLPPGKDKRTIGDQINWEYLIDSVPNGEDIHLISDDKDYYSVLDENEVDPHLQKEWTNLKKSTIFYYRNLTSFFYKNFPETKLTGEYHKDFLIEALSTSGSFDQSREVLAKLSKIGDFSNDQINKIVKASLENTQIYGAHQYTPSKIGEILEKIVIGKHQEIDYENYSLFCQRFSIHEELRSEDFPF